jgi:hypothetical protein
MVLNVTPDIQEKTLEDSVIKTILPRGVIGYYAPGVSILPRQS